MTFWVLVLWLSANAVTTVTGFYNESACTQAGDRFQKAAFKYSGYVCIPVGIENKP